MRNQNLNSNIALLDETDRKIVEGMLEYITSTTDAKTVSEMLGDVFFIISLAVAKDYDESRDEIVRRSSKFSDLLYQINELKTVFEGKCA